MTTGEHAPFDPERLLLPTLVGGLIADLGGPIVLGFAFGRTAMRDAIVRRLHCSHPQAEQVVETLITQGLARFVGAPGAASLGYWMLEARIEVG